MQDGASEGGAKAGGEPASTAVDSAAVPASRPSPFDGAAAAPVDSVDGRETTAVVPAAGAAVAPARGPRFIRPIIKCGPAAGA